MKVDFDKNAGLVPVIIQDDCSEQVLMLGYMNEAALEQTKREKRVTFYSRSKQRLWTKGEASGNYLEVKEMCIDCDKDSILIRVDPLGPTCHTGEVSCFGVNTKKYSTRNLERTINKRLQTGGEDSYSVSLSKRGINKVAQKVGEEAVELVIEALGSNESLFLNEAADLMFHYLLLLQNKGYCLADVEAVLGQRAKQD